MGVPAGYIAALDLEPLLIDRDTGAPLTNGTIWFYQDSARNVPKNVYEIQNLGGAPPVYNFVALPNPVNLAAFGTQQDNAGNNVAIYYYPYDANGNIQLYFVQVYNSNGVLQLTREAWPPGVTAQNGPANQDGNLANQLSNPQFAVVNFLPNNPLVIQVTGAGAFTYSGIIPDWNINVTATAATTVTITRTAIAGSAALPNNPPYTLSVLPGANITAISLSQRLYMDPNIWAPANAAAANGWLASSILLANGTTVTMQYQPNGLVPTNILTATNTSGAFATFTNTIQLPPATNPSTGDTGYVDIILNFPVVGTSTFSNVQVVPVSTNLVNVAYDQTPVNRQIDQLFNYYNPLLQYKPIPSYLVGWDFPLNPAQPLGLNIAASAAGGNTSSYTWDQTILFQSVNNGAATSLSALGQGAMRITATNATQFALIQYLSATGPDIEVRDMLQNFLSCNILGCTSVAAGISGTISLWITNSANLPSTIGANQSLVATLTPNGKPATFNGGPWTEILRSNLGDAIFTLPFANTGILFDSGFSGWNNPKQAVGVANYIAIVVGFQTLPIGQTVDIGSISCVPGLIPTRPAPTTFAENIIRCQYYYEKSFSPGIVPATRVGTAGGMMAFQAQTTTAPPPMGVGVVYPIYFNTPKYQPPVMTGYNPVNNDANIYNFRQTVSGVSSFAYTSQTFSHINVTNNGAGSNSGDVLGIYWTADSRLGQ